MTSNISQRPSREMPNVTRATAQRRFRTFSWKASSNADEAISPTTFPDLSFPLIIPRNTLTFSDRGLFNPGSSRSHLGNVTVAESFLLVKAAENEEPKDRKTDQPDNDPARANRRHFLSQIYETFPGRCEFQRALLDGRYLHAGRSLQLNFAK